MPSHPANHPANHPIFILPELAKSRHLKHAKRIAAMMQREAPTAHGMVVCHLIPRESDQTFDPIQEAWDRDDVAICAFMAGAQ